MNDQRWGRVIRVTLPGGGSIGVYEPRHGRPASPNPVVDRGAYVAVYTALLQAWNNRLPDRFAALFTPDATVVGFDGSLMNGRADIVAQIANLRVALTAAYVAIVRDVRAVGPGTVLLRAAAGMVPRDGGALIEKVNAQQSALFVDDRRRPAGGAVPEHTGGLPRPPSRSRGDDRRARRRRPQRPRGARVIIRGLGPSDSHALSPRRSLVRWLASQCSPL